ncbi:DsbA family oxidoreductase [Halobaculum sp. D14]|uniref:DsbA family oxidoreductase n=1 Tax=Halobaculum sp. D14 TaxID=3421642 RepID=UPI003EBFE016
MSTQQPDDTLAVYADFVCPFCYLGRASLRTYLADRAAGAADGDDATSDDGVADVSEVEADLDVEWRFFDLRSQKRGPDGEIRDDVDDGKDEEYFAQVRENVERLKAQYGAEMLGLDEVPDVDSWATQQAALYVKQSYDRATFLSFYDAVLDAYWVDGRDIEQPDVVAELAESVGVDGDEVRDAMGDESLSAELEQQFQQAQRLGISGVPTFVYGEHAARGAVPPEHLERLVEAEH